MVVVTVEFDIVVVDVILRGDSVVKDEVVRVVMTTVVLVGVILVVTETVSFLERLVVPVITVDVDDVVARLC